MGRDSERTWERDRFMKRDVYCRVRLIPVQRGELRCLFVVVWFNEPVLLGLRVRMWFYCVVCYHGQISICVQYLGLIWINIKPWVFSLCAFVCCNHGNTRVCLVTLRISAPLRCFVLSFIGFSIFSFVLSLSLFFSPALCPKFQFLFLFSLPPSLFFSSLSLVPKPPQKTHNF